MANETKHRIRLLAGDVLALTSLGENELKASSTGLSPSELELLVLIDGNSTILEIAKRAKTMPAASVAPALEELVARNLAAISGRIASGDIDVGDFLKTGVFYVPQNGGTPVSQDEANEGVSTLRKNGYYVRIARRAAEEHKAAGGGRLTAVIIEDEASLAKLLKSFLGMEGYDTRVAGNRAEILDALRQQIGRAHV